MTTFKGTVASDFLKSVSLTDTQKADLIDFSSSDFISLRDSLIKYIQAAYPLDYQNFSESDLGMMLIELVAYMGSVLSLKADMLANENYISTARSRYNVKKLLELIGVRLRGPTAAVSNARATFTSPITEAFLTVRPENRTTTITSPEDGGPLSFTAYKIQGGKITALDNTDGNITLFGTEATDPTNPTTWTNLALLEGSLVLQTGTFGSYGTGVPTVSLTKGPVIEGSVQAFVNAPADEAASGTFTQVESLYFASGVSAKIFQVNLDDSFGATLVFGDGTTGVRPPPNADYLITYRVGGGSRGNIQESFLNSVINAYDGNSDVLPVGGALENTSMATGGSDAETIAHAKKYAPLFFKSQDRLVTLQDYEAHSNKYLSNYSTMGKATAAVRKAYSSANIIDVYVLEKASDLQLQQASTSFKIGLLNYLNERKMMTDEIVIVDGVIRALDLVVTVNCDRELEPIESTIKSKVRDTLISYFNVDNMNFGKTVPIADLNRSIFKEVEEVRYSTIDNIEGNIIVDFNEIVQLNNFVINVTFI